MSEDRAWEQHAVNEKATVVIQGRVYRPGPENLKNTDLVGEKLSRLRILYNSSI